MAYLLEYLGPRGWSVGHSGTTLNDPAAYVARRAKRGLPTRVTDLETGEVFGDSPPPCGACGTAHTGLEGSCLI